MKFSSVFRMMLQPRIARPALKVSLVVGTFLNLVNNGERLWLGADVNPLHLLLNYMVPFCVSSYSAARNACSNMSRSLHADCAAADSVNDPDPGPVQSVADAPFRR
jgi:hypothetical protein